MRLKRPDGMNIIPFVDVMLVLLTITLMVSTFTTQNKIDVDLPTAQSGIKSQSGKKSLQIVISKNGDIFIDNKKVSFDELKIEIAPLENSDEITILADRLSNFGNFTTIIDILKTKGYENIYIAVKDEK